MRRFRIGKNIAIEWLLYENDGNVHNLAGKELELYMTCGGLKFVVTDYTVTENAVAWTFPAAAQTRTGYYKLVLVERDAAMGLKSYDVKEAFCLEPEDALTNIETIEEGGSLRIKSVLTYARITNIASISQQETTDGTAVTFTLTNGKTFTILLGSYGSGGGGGSDIDVIDNLFSYNSDDALSANQGRVLKGLIDQIQGVDVVDDLLSTSGTKALSANMGRELKRLIDSIDVNPGTPGTSVTIVDNLIEGGSNKALSAEQGKVLKALIDAIPGSSSSDQAQMMFSASENPGTPATNSGAWHSAQTSSDVWMAIRFKVSGEWGDWSVIYIGDIEVPYASFKAFAFKRAAATASVSAPTGGSYSSPVPTTTGWSDGIPSGTGAVWMSSRTFASDDTHSDSAWSTPTILADNDYMDYEFSAVANPGTPSKTGPSATETNPNWSNTATEATIWMAMREVSNGEYKSGSSWMVVKIKGENGQDGTSVTIKGSVSSVGDLPSSGNTAGDGYILTTNGHLYVWDGDSWEDCGQIKGDPGEDGATPYIHIKYSNDGGVNFTGNGGEDPGDYIGIYWDYTATDSSDVTDYVWKLWKGQDGFGYEYIFRLTLIDTAPNLPSSSPNTDDYVPVGWTDDPGGVTAEFRWCWVAWRKKEDGVWSAWRGTTGGKARLYAHFGADGQPGSAGQGQFKSIVFLRSATQPSTPGNSTVKYLSPDIQTIGTPNTSYGGTFADPVPYGWSDGIPAPSSTNDPDSLVNTLWMTSRVFTSDGLSPQDANWKTPVQATDNDDWDFEYAYQQTNDAKPADPTTENRHGGSGTQIWFDPVDDYYTSGTTRRDFSEMYWMAMRPKINGVGVGAWTVLRIKGEAGTPGVDGKDAKPLRIRNWSQVYGQTLTGNDKVFSGYEDGAPFRDVLVITKYDYPNGTTYPFSQQVNGVSENVPALVMLNYSSTYSSGRSGTELPYVVSGNYIDTLPANASDSASAAAGGYVWCVFTNLGAVYAAVLVATQGYIGSLTVDHLTTNAGNNSYIVIDDGFIRFYDSNNKKRIEMGQGANDTSPVLRFFDTDGETELYNLGPDGITQLGYEVTLPEWQKTNFRYTANRLSVGSTYTPSSYSTVALYKYSDATRITVAGGVSGGLQFYNPVTKQWQNSHSPYHDKYFAADSNSFTAPTSGYYIAYSYRTDGTTASVPVYDFAAATTLALGTYYIGSMGLSNVNVTTMGGTVQSWSDYSNS